MVVARGVKFDEGLGERSVSFLPGSLRDSRRMIVPGGFEGAKGSFGECTGINLDVRSFVRSDGRRRGGEERYRRPHPFDSRVGIASLFFALAELLLLAGARIHGSSSHAQPSLDGGGEGRWNKCARVRSTTRRALDIQAKEGRERENAEYPTSSRPSGSFYSGGEYR